MLKNNPEGDFWLPYLRSCLQKLPDRAITNNYQCMIDFSYNHTITVKTVSNWDGDVLIIESEDETGFTLSERKNLRNLYPHASIVVLEDAGHFSFITQTRKFNEAITKFMKTLS
jgi:pimeloyl-ACP methyl ester carboxylesterase